MHSKCCAYVGDSEYEKEKIMFYGHYFFSEPMGIAGDQHVYYFLRVYKYSA